MNISTRTEIRAILPMGDQFNPAHTSTHNAFERAICEIAGGFTLTGGRGAWRHPETGEIIKEQVRVYDIAIDEPSEFDAVRAALITAGRAMGEHTVYLRDDLSIVQLIEIPRD